jgi:hypothetical protein
VIIQVWCRQQRLQNEIISELYASDTFIEPFKDPKTGRVDHEVYQADLTIRARSVLCPLSEQHPAHRWMAEQEEAKLSLREVERGAQLGAMLRRHLAEQVALKERQLKEREDFEEHFDERFDEHERQLQATAHQGIRPRRGRVSS